MERESMRWRRLGNAEMEVVMLVVVLVAVQVMAK